MTATYAHGVIDLETIGNKSVAPIVQIGIALPNPNGGERIFNAKIHYPGNDYLGLTPDQSTMNWWEKQPEETFMKVFGSHIDGVQPMLLNDALVYMLEFFQNYKKRYGIEIIYLWSHATFDTPILYNSLEKVNLDDKFRNLVHYREMRDFRTSDWILGDAVKGEIYAIVDRKAKDLHLTHHYAPDDALYELMVLDQQLKALRYFFDDDLDKSHLHLYGELKLAPEKS